MGYHHFHHRPWMPLPTTRSRGAATPIPNDPSQFADPEDDDDIHMSPPSTHDHPTTRMMNIKQEDLTMNDHHHHPNNYHTPHMELVPFGVSGYTDDPHHYNVGLLLSSPPDPVGSNMDAVTISSAGDMTVQTYSSLVSRTSGSSDPNNSSSLSSSYNNHHNHTGVHPHGAAAAAHPYEDTEEHHWIPARLHERDYYPEPDRKKRPHDTMDPPPTTYPTVDIPRTEMSLVATSRILPDDVSGLSSEPPSQSEHPPMAAAAMSSTWAPRARLHHWYARPPRSKVISNVHYHGWPDSTEKTHIQQWTAILVCPMTGELFRAGPYPSLFEATPITLTHYNDQCQGGATGAAACTTWWFAKKTYAEHGAAARAYDCWTVRDGDHDAPKMMGTEPPHREPIYQLPDLMVIPYEIRQNILRQQAEIRRIGGLPPV